MANKKHAVPRLIKLDGVWNSENNRAYEYYLNIVWIYGPQMLIQDLKIVSLGFHLNGFFLGVYVLEMHYSNVSV